MAPPNGSSSAENETFVSLTSNALVGNRMAEFRNNIDRATAQQLSLLMAKLKADHEKLITPDVQELIQRRFDVVKVELQNLQDTVAKAQLETLEQRLAALKTMPAETAAQTPAPAEAQKKPGIFDKAVAFVNEKIFGRLGVKPATGSAALTGTDVAGGIKRRAKRFGFELLMTPDKIVKYVPIPGLSFLLGNTDKLKQTGELGIMNLDLEDAIRKANAKRQPNAQLTAGKVEDADYALIKEQMGKDTTLTISKMFAKWLALQRPDQPATCKGESLVKLEAIKSSGDQQRQEQAALDRMKKLEAKRDAINGELKKINAKPITSLVAGTTTEFTENGSERKIAMSEDDIANLNVNEPTQELRLLMDAMRMLPTARSIKISPDAAAPARIDLQKQAFVLSKDIKGVKLADLQRLAEFAHENVDVLEIGSRKIRGDVPRARFENISNASVLQINVRAIPALIAGQKTGLDTAGAIDDDKWILSGATWQPDPPRSTVPLRPTSTPV